MGKIIMKELISSETAKFDPLVIYESQTSRRVFIGKIHECSKKDCVWILENHLSGSIVHQKKNKKGEWENIDSIKLNTLKSGEGVLMNFTSEQLQKLYDCLTIAYGIAEQNIRDPFYEVENTAEILENTNDEQLVKILDLLSEDKTGAIAVISMQKKRKTALQQFLKMLNEDVKEPDWQSFFSKNEWIFGYGLNYVYTSVITEQALVGGKNYRNEGGQVVDFLSATKSLNAQFTVLVEIKRSNTKLLGSEIRNSIYPISTKLSEAISQIQGYCETWSTGVDCRSTFEKENPNIHTCQPQGILIIGNTKELMTGAQKQSFERFRQNLHNPKIITFDELYKRAEYIVGKNN